MKLTPIALTMAVLLIANIAHAQEGGPAAAVSSPANVAATDALDRVWSGHSVKFALATSATRVYVAYYDASRQLTLAERAIGGGAWTYTKLDTWNGWDSHNYIAMALDNAGRLHIAANMHAVPVIYFRSDTSGEIATLKRQPIMANASFEQSMTYPIFLHDAQGRLIYKYRDGHSGNGNEIYLVLDNATAQWHPLLATPLTDGEGQRNAYFMGPVLGPDHWFHIAWVWRESPMAETNHDLSYAKSPDLVHWFHADGTPFTLPIRLSAAEIVDPVPVKGGMINNNTVIGFDDKGRAMITYHKYDAAGNTQIWVARYEGGDGKKGRWRLVQVSRWQNYRWDFHGGGTLNSELFVAGVEPIGNGLLKVPVVRLGKSVDFIIRADDLALVEERSVVSLTDRLKAQIKVPDGMQLNVVDEPSGRFALAWPARPPHRDEPSPDIPDPTTLDFITLVPATK